MKKLSERQKIERATKIQNEAYAKGVTLATEHLNRGRTLAETKVKINQGGENK